MKNKLKIEDKEIEPKASVSFSAKDRTTFSYKYHKNPFIFKRAAITFVPKKYSFEILASKVLVCIYRNKFWNIRSIFLKILLRIHIYTRKARYQIHIDKMNSFYSVWLWSSLPVGGYEFTEFRIGFFMHFSVLQVVYVTISIILSALAILQYITMM